MMHSGLGRPAPRRSLIVMVLLLAGAAFFALGIPTA